MTKAEPGTELDRILSLPTTPDVDLQELARKLTTYLKRPECSTDFQLFEFQAKALWVAADKGGLFADADVGAGKTLLSLLIPVVCQIERPLLVVPANLVHKTKVEFAEFNRTFDLKPVRIATYTEISRSKNAEGESTLLHDINPDGIILDEADRLSNLKSGRTRKVMKYIASKRPKVFVMSGSFFHSSLMDFWHHMLWALREDAPLPLKRPVAERWADAVDPGTTDEERQQAASTLGFPDGEPREHVGRWLRQTFGVVTAESKFDGAIHLHSVPLDIAPSAADAIESARAGLRPDGDDLSTPMDKWRLCMQLAAGFWTYYDPPPPDEWLKARKALQSFVNAILDGSTKYDTKEAVERAIRRGNLPSGAPILDRWAKVRDTFQPKTVAKWIDDQSPTVQYAVRWVKEKPGRLVWVNYVEVGEHIARLAGVPYYGAGQGVNGAPHIESIPGLSCVVSFGANRAGRNLQAWNENLYLTVPSKSHHWEQSLGRTARTGQTKDVHVYLVQSLPEHERALEAAQESARCVQGLRDKTPLLMKAIKGDMSYGQIL